MPTVQKLYKKLETAIGVGVKYFSILKLLNNLDWTEKEIEMLAFIGARGVPRKGGDRELFGAIFNTDAKAAYNLTYRLYKKGLLIEEDGKRTLHPSLRTPYSDGIELQIRLEYE